ncbi:MAG TPA: hypothetical protein VIF64_21290 [Pyrinomonadaceae bacterium]
MSAKTLQVLGFVFLVAAAVLAILNLKRVANLGTMWAVPLVLIVGLGLLAVSRRKSTPS